MARRGLAIALAAAAALLLAGRLVADLWVEWAWFDALGAGAVWRARLVESLLLHGIGGLVASAFVFANLYAVRHSVVALVLPRRVGNLEFGQEVSHRALLSVVVVLSLVVGALLTLPLGEWHVAALARSGLPFGEADPYFESDLGYFVNVLPFERDLHGWAGISLLVVSAVVVFLYALTPSLRWERGRLHLSSYVRRHVSVLVACLVALLAWRFRLDAYALLIDRGPEAIPFGALDHRVGIPANLVLAVVTLASSLLIVWAGWTGQVRVVAATALTLLVLSLGLRELLPPLADRWFGAGRPSRDEAYAATRAGYTRRAFAVDRLRGDTAIATPSAPLARLVSAWDPPLAQRAVARGSGEWRPVGDLGWEARADGLHFVSVREGRADFGSRFPQATARRLAAWRSTLDLADDSASVLLPPVLVRDSAPGYLLVADTAGRVAAAPLDGWWSRLAHAWSQQNLRLIGASMPGPGPRMILRRDVRARLRALAPFFAQGTAITPIVHGDSLVWAVELYATSRTYPLSRGVRLGEQRVTYQRHAATAFVQSFTGRVTLVARDSTDPVTRSWIRRFPGMFTPAERIPPSMRRLVAPPVDDVRAVAQAFALAGPRREWAPRRVLAPVGGDTLVAAASPAFVVGGPDGAPTLAWAVPLVDGSDRLEGFVHATGGDERRLSWIPAAAVGAAGLRWNEALERLAVAADSSLPGERDARLVLGRVRALPRDGGLSLVQPAVAVGASRAPRVVRVAHLRLGAPGDEVLRAAPTVAGAFGERESAGGAAEPTATAPELYARMREALRRGDWAAFGEAFEELGRVLERR